MYGGDACARSNEFVRLRRGVHVRAQEWTAASVDRRYRARIDAVAATWTAPFFLRESAAAIWGLPLVEPLGETVHVAASPSVGSRRRNGIAEHGSVEDPEPVVLEGFAVSGLARTVLDLCRYSSFRRAVTAADHALRMRDRDGAILLERSELEGRVTDLPPRARGRAAAARAVAFADPLAETPLESISRVALQRAGLPAPVLQRAFHDGDGLAGEVDFSLEGTDVIGEADGAHKNTDPRFLRGRTPEQALLDEKRREDRLRLLVKGFVRWGWREAYTERPLITLLARAGVGPDETSSKRRDSPLLQDVSTLRGRLD
ncbi:hypothetical protein B0T42_11680 [Rathayibacter sp. VKM Ac-2630]|nr:hypothetical protein B0T42_11680 [Rathayibacter sp. VKM Ac-2630]